MGLLQKLKLKSEWDKLRAIRNKIKKSKKRRLYEK